MTLRQPNYKIVYKITREATLAFFKLAKCEAKKHYHYRVIH